MTPKNKTASWDAVRKIENSPALRNAGAKVILNQKGEVCGMIKIAHPADGAGRLTVILHEHGLEPQVGSASGCGYDKVSAAIDGMTFAGMTLTDHPHNWEAQLRDAGYNVYTVL
jgi:hypothetical protein